jgi:hypothetical protein
MITRIQQLWGYVSLHWNHDSLEAFIIDGEEVGFEYPVMNYSSVSCAIIGDYLILSGPRILILKRGLREPIIHTNPFVSVIFNEDVCYYTVPNKYFDDQRIRITKTTDLLTWLLIDKPFYNLMRDYIQLLEEKSQKLAECIHILMGGISEGFNNVGHVTTKTWENFQIMNLSLHGAPKINISGEQWKLCPYGRYAVSFGYTPRSSGFSIDIGDITVETKIMKGLIEYMEIVSDIKIREHTEVYVDGESPVSKWIDSETVLAYGSNAVLLNVSTNEHIDITVHADSVDIDTSESAELFILEDESKITIENVKRMSRHLKHHRQTSGLPELYTKLIDKAYEYIQ